MSNHYTDTTKARAVRLEQTAIRAIDNPVKLAWAARIVRVAIARGRMTTDDLTSDVDRDAA